jgi:hypothetical protein
VDFVLQNLNCDSDLGGLIARGIPKHLQVLLKIAGEGGEIDKSIHRLSSWVWCSRLSQNRRQPGSPVLMKRTWSLP